MELRFGGAPPPATAPPLPLPGFEGQVWSLTQIQDNAFSTFYKHETASAVQKAFLTFFSADYVLPTHVGKTLKFFSFEAIFAEISYIKN